MGKKERLYLFIHVPKTGGSTFRKILKNNFGESCFIENPYMSLQKYSKKQIEQLFFHYPAKVFAGHVFSLRESLKANNSSIQLIAFTRDPIQKALSSYYYLRNREITNPNHPIKKKSFSKMVDFVIKMKKFNSFYLDSSQLEWLVGGEDAKMDEVKKAVKSGRLLLFPMENFDFSCVLLEKMFPKDFKDCSYGSQANVSIRPSKINKKLFLTANKLPWINKDRKLHEFSKQNILDLSNTLFESQQEIDSALSDFKLRCENKKKHKNKSVLPRTKSFFRRFF